MMQRAPGSLDGPHVLVHMLDVTLWWAWFVMWRQGRLTHRSTISNHASSHKKNELGPELCMCGWPGV